MKFSEKLQKLRKENNMSQEDLADKLDVSRQSVSKWESGQTYPEMDKLLTMCKIFNVTLDDLTNDDIKYNEVKTKNNKTWSNLIDGIVYIIDKSYTMFKNMTNKEKGKCVGELLILFVVLLILKLPFDYVIDMGGYAIEAISGSYGLIRLWDFLINIIYLILFSFTFIYIYKTYYLDKYTINKKKEIEKEEIKEEKNKEEQEIKENSKKEKVYKEPYHFGTKLFEFLGKIISYIIKFFLIIMAFPLTISFVSLFIALIMMIILLCKGVFYFGPLICIIAGIIINAIIIKLIMSFLFNYKPIFRVLFISFMVGLGLMGAGIGIAIIEVASTEISEEAPITKLEYTTKVDEYTMEDNLFIRDYEYYYFNDVDFETDESLGNTVRVEISYYKDLRYVESYKNSYNNFTEIDFNYNGKYSKKFLDLIIDNLKDKKLYNYDKLFNCKIKIITTSSNIEKLKENKKRFYESEHEYDNRISAYIFENDRLIGEIDELQEDIYELKEEIYTLKEENNTLKEKINNYKNNIDMLD